MEHPEIANAIRTGYPHGEPKWPRCPVCGEECERIFRGGYNTIVGCDECVTIENAWEAAECIEEE